MLEASDELGVLRLGPVGVFVELCVVIGAEPNQVFGMIVLRLCDRDDVGSLAGIGVGVTDGALAAGLILNLPPDTFGHGRPAAVLLGPWEF